MSNVTQTQDLSNDTGNFYQSGQTYVGMKFNSASALGVGKKLVSWRMSIRKQGTPPGTLYARLYDSDDVQKEQSSTTVTASTVSETFANYTFTFAGTTEIEDGDYVVCQYGESTSGSDYLKAEFQDTDVYDGTDSCWITENGGVNTGADAKFQLVYTGSQPSSGTSRDPPPPIELVRF